MPTIFSGLIASTASRIGFVELRAAASTRRSAPSAPSKSSRTAWIVLSELFMGAILGWLVVGPPAYSGMGARPMAMSVRVGECGAMFIPGAEA